MEKDKDLTHPHFVGWSEEFETGNDMVPGPNAVQFKIIATKDGLQIIAIGEDMEKIRDILKASGFPENQIKKLICG